MTKPEAYNVYPSPGPKQIPLQELEATNQPQPLSGSKTVKNHNHSRNRHGEGK